ncbi:BLUF domain-containing protein [Microlunatus flavus]|uniref:Sensors of blue-light using FAD n=1 Tax=Microlunatus flavus TaxID=1036181 RepID=A0A1H9D3I0_9ACTN|nr:BLUF domain-containing protein [Microlunatus flavus]SEQ07393.1 Sensors of blue-light using FAD [Microlunatus flavus]
MLYSLAYESQASVPFTESDLLDLLARSRANNARLDVTGILLYRQGTFLQVLEGARDQVEGLYATISADSRHHAVDTVLVEDRASRRFPEWTMGFADVDGHLGDVDGFNDVLSSVQGPDGEDSPQFRELLALFGNED